MKNLVLLLIVAVVFVPVWSENLEMKVAKKSFLSNEVIKIHVKHNMRDNDQLWDTYLFFMLDNKTPVYITYNGTSLSPEPLKMLPRVLELKTKNVLKSMTAQVYLVLCKYKTQNIIAKAKVSLRIIKVGEVKRPILPTSPQLLYNKQDSPALRDSRYSDYKQFRGSWANEKLGHSSRTIKQSGCALCSACNIIGWTPTSLNNHLKSNGGFVSGNLIVWSKVPGIRFKGSGSISSSLFSSYHVIANVGGHFVLLTGYSNGRYSSKDPGKSSNPTYSSGNIYSVRLYYK